MANGTTDGGGNPLNRVDASAYPNKLHGVNLARITPRGYAITILRLADQTLVILPGIAGHCHSIDEFGSLDCGCTLPLPKDRARSFSSSRRVPISITPSLYTIITFIASFVYHSLNSVLYASTGLGRPFIYAQEITAISNKPTSPLQYFVILILVTAGVTLLVGAYLNRHQTTVKISCTQYLNVGDTIYIRGHRSIITRKTDHSITVRKVLG